jgi:hypothetical protein
VVLPRIHNKTGKDMTKISEQYEPFLPATSPTSKKLTTASVSISQGPLGPELKATSKQEGQQDPKVVEKFAQVQESLTTSPHTRPTASLLPRTTAKSSSTKRQNAVVRLFHALTSIPSSLYQIFRNKPVKSAYETTLKAEIAVENCEKIVNLLSKKILDKWDLPENQGGWGEQRVGIFRVPGSQISIDKAEAHLRNSPPEEYEHIINEMNLTLPDLAGLVKRFTRSALQFPESTKSTFMEKTPHLQTLLNAAADKKVTKLTEETLKTSFPM